MLDFDNKKKINVIENLGVGYNKESAINSVKACYPKYFTPDYIITLVKTEVVLLNS